VFIGAVTGLFIVYRQFDVKEIKVINADQSVNIMGLYQYKNQNLLLINLQQAADYIYRANPKLSQVKVSKSYPNTLIISVEWASGLAQIQVANGYFLLDEKARIIEKNKMPRIDFPLIHYYQLLNYLNYDSGEQLDFQDLKDTLFLLVRMRSLNFNVLSVDINGTDMLAFNLKDKTVLFTTDKDLNVQWQQAADIYRQLKINGKDFHRLDLRYDQPVIGLSD